MLQGIDLLVFDIQDVGVRFYTYTSTLFLSLEAAAENKVPYLVLDRPNPIAGLRVDGPILEPAQKSFVGLLPLPVIHGMTVGELARLVNGEKWLKDGVQAELRVIPAEGWTRDLWFDQTGLPWVKPSPSMTTLKTATVYPATCFIEGTNASEGRGTETPFESIGAPYIDGGKLAAEMNGLGLPGVFFRATKFTPRDIAQVTSDPKHEGVECGGIFLDVTDRNAFNPILSGIHLLAALKKLYPDDFKWRSPGALDQQILSRSADRHAENPGEPRRGDAPGGHRRVLSGRPRGDSSGSAQNTCSIERGRSAENSPAPSSRIVRFCPRNGVYFLDTGVPRGIRFFRRFRG